jgi:hypothetical protein
MLLLPLFLGEDTERHIENVGGRIIFEASAGSWASTPDAPGKDKMVNRKDRGRPAPIGPRPGVAMDAKFNALGHRIRIWWASQAPTQASDEYMTETGAHKLSIDGWSHEFIWRRGDII